MGTEIDKIVIEADGFEGKVLIEHFKHDLVISFSYTVSGPIDEETIKEAKKLYKIIKE